MSSDGSGTLGVTNHKGQLLKGFEKDCHKGIVIVDGSVVPLALGANPFATITALAERSVEEVAKEGDINIDYETKNGKHIICFNGCVGCNVCVGVLNLFGRPAHPHPRASEGESLQYARNIIKSEEEGKRSGIEFTEVMEGNLYTGDDIDDFEIATRAAIDSGDTARFYLSAHAWDTDSCEYSSEYPSAPIILTWKVLSRSDHPALLTGTMTCRALSRDPFMVLRGNLQLFNQDFRSPDTTDLTYNFDMVSTTGEVIHFNGYKTVNESMAFSPWAVWKAASTIYVTLTDSSGARIARGTLFTSPSAFEAEARTITSTSPSLFGRIKSSSQFLSFLAMHVLKSFIGPLNPLQWPSASYSGYIADKVPPVKMMQVTASDGVETTLRMWNPTTAKGPQPAKVRILMIPGVATDHQIFALPTIRRNAVEYFTAAGHEVFVITHRIGKTILAEKGYTTFDARLDIKAALGKVRKLQDSPEKIYIIAHGEGSMALAMALLDGTIPAPWIEGITASNVFMHPKFTTTASSLFSFPRLYKAIAGSWFSCTSTPADPFTQRTIDQALRFYPVGGVKEMCNSVVCHRASLVFGRLYTHAYLNSDTHNTLSRLLGGISVRNYTHIASMARSASHQVTDNESVSLVTPQNLQNLKGIPILLFSGADNARWSPESTDISYNALRDALGEDMYERAVWLGKGDLDCWIGEGNGGVLGRVRGHVDSCGRGEDDDA